jgi:anti-anti-sigma factor
MAEELRANVRRQGELAIIDLEGDVTIFAEEAISRAYQEASDDNPTNIALNFTRSEYINSAGIAVIINIVTEARKNSQRIFIVGLTPHFQKIFKMVGLAQYAQILDTEEEVHSHLSSQVGD